jgi:hypothetical protein
VIKVQIVHPRVKSCLCVASAKLQVLSLTEECLFFAINFTTGKIVAGQSTLAQSFSPFLAQDG